jgi:hypothetical protein
MSGTGWGIWTWKKWARISYLYGSGLPSSCKYSFITRSPGTSSQDSGLENLYADFSGGLTWLTAFYFTWKHFK